MENNHELEDELRPEYDFSKMKGGIKGKYVERYQAGTNVILTQVASYKLHRFDPPKSPNPPF